METIVTASGGRNDAASTESAQSTGSTEQTASAELKDSTLGVGWIRDSGGSRGPAEGWSTGGDGSCRLRAAERGRQKSTVKCRRVNGVKG